ncbi:uncharacterized protein L203_101710 [Cryptococcus depauperatus CBS 7841]|uniref:Uncharacterized protein n=1 Tax=Cryptococcus depauperatus CBS 7841 TaxID=1295531 RepID=A0A1E3HPA4_9TREE|nr:hypothetical protein L203_06237 [Cryptococcus depauperatus CBS 7841]
MSSWFSTQPQSKANEDALSDSQTEEFKKLLSGRYGDAFHGDGSLKLGFYTHDGTINAFNTKTGNLEEITDDGKLPSQNDTSAASAQGTNAATSQAMSGKRQSRNREGPNEKFQKSLSGNPADSGNEDPWVVVDNPEDNVRGGWVHVKNSKR